MGRAANSVGLFIVLAFSLFFNSASAESAVQLKQSFSDAQKEILQLRLKETTNGVPEIHQSRFDGFSEPTKEAVLILHGLYESPNYLKGLINYFKSRGMNVFSILLSGHWQPKDFRMANVSFQDWVSDADVGLRIAKKLGQKVYVLGYSTGGLMAADLAMRYPEDVSGLFLFAPALALTARTEGMLLTGFAIGFFPAESCVSEPLSEMCKTVAKIASGSVERAIPLIREGLSLSPLPGIEVMQYYSDIYNRFKWTVPFEDSSGRILPMQTTLAKIYASRIRTPTFLVVSEEDITISTPVALDLFSQLSGLKQSVVYGKSDNIGHTNITKYEQDAYKASPDYFNHFTLKLEESMDEFLSKLAR